METSKHHYDRYMRFIEHYKSLNIPLKRRRGPNVDAELHHIIPTCIGGTDDKSNLVMLPYRAHYISHYMLAKAFPSETKLWFAFNMMKRVCDGKSVLYAAARKYISAVVSKTNKGLIRNQSVRDAISKQATGRVTVKDKDGNTLSTRIDDPRYLSGEYVYYRVGYEHKDSTIEKMKKNGLRNRKLYHDPVTFERIYVKEDETVPDGYILGEPQHVKDAIAERAKRKGYRQLKLKKCPHCGAEGKGGNMSRYHFNGCKHKPTAA